MARAYPEGTHLVQVDDDVVNLKVVRLSGGGVKTKVTAKPGALHRCVTFAERAMRAEGAFMRGCNPSANSFFLKPGEVSRKNGLVLGSLFGCRNRHDATLQASLSTGGQREDVERTLRHVVRDGRVVRLMFCAVTSRHTQNGGGMQAEHGRPEHRDAEARSVARQLARLWPNLGDVDAKDDRKFRFKPVGPAPLVRRRVL